MTSKQPALVLASGGFNGKLAKTAFGLIRSSERFQIVGVLDPEQAGQEAGQIVDGKDRGIGIYTSVAEAYAQAQTTPEVAKESKCANCVAFDISPRMLECMPGLYKMTDNWECVGCTISNAILLDPASLGQQVGQ